MFSISFLLSFGGYFQLSEVLTVAGEVSCPDHRDGCSGGGTCICSCLTTGICRYDTPHRPRRMYQLRNESTLNLASSKSCWHLAKAWWRFQSGEVWITEAFTLWFDLVTHSQPGSSPGQKPLSSAVCRRLQHHWDESTRGSADPKHLCTQPRGDSEGTEGQHSAALKIFMNRMFAWPFHVCSCHVSRCWFDSCTNNNWELFPIQSPSCQLTLYLSCGVCPFYNVSLCRFKLGHFLPFRSTTTFLKSMTSQWAVHFICNQK